MSRNITRRVKTEAVVKIGDHIEDMRLETLKLSNIAEHLQTYIDEMQNLYEWLGEEFDSGISRKARLRLKEVICEMQKIKNGAM